MGLYLIGDCAGIVEMFVAECVQIEGHRFVLLVGLEHENEPIFFMVSQGKPRFDADIGTHTAKIDGVAFLEFN
jgi:hypothetical protein